MVAIDRPDATTSETVPRSPAIHFINLFRPINLLIIALVQVLLAYKVVFPALRSHSIYPELHSCLMPMFIVCTSIIAAGGYVINDIFDTKADRLNNRHRTIVSGLISNVQAYYIYGALFAIGSIIALFVTWSVSKPLYFVIYPISFALLWYYSFKLQHRSAYGNLLIALFSGGVVWIFLLAEWPSLSELMIIDPIMGKHVIRVLVAFGLFAFFISYCRELVKDLEDREWRCIGGKRIFSDQTRRESDETFHWHIASNAGGHVIVLVDSLFQPVTC